MCVSERMEGVRETYINGRMANANKNYRLSYFGWGGGGGKTVGTILCT